MVIGATNRPESLDEAARRRFVRRLYVPLPNDESRKQLVLKVQKEESEKGFVFDLNLGEIGEIVMKTEGYSCADMFEVLKEASMYPVREMMMKFGIENCDQWQKEKMRSCNIIDV